jgi:hypothetical protein
MTDARILFPEFRDEQSDSKYPFVDQATLLSETGAVQFTGDTFIDATLFPIGAGAELYVSTVVVDAQTVTIYVGDAVSTERASVQYSAVNPPASGVLALTDSYGRPAGVLVSSPLRLSTITTWPPGTHTFTATATAFVAAACIPANEPGVRGLRTPDGRLLTGDVWLVGDGGVVLSVTDNAIRVDVVGVPLFKRFVCEPLDDFPARRYLKTINGCGPDAYGNFTITATNQLVTDPVLRVYPQNGTITFDTAGRSTA